MSGWAIVIIVVFDIMVIGLMWAAARAGRKLRREMDEVMEEDRTEEAEEHWWPDDYQG